MKLSDGHEFAAQVSGYLVNPSKEWSRKKLNEFLDFDDLEKSTVLKPTLVDLLKKLRPRENHVEGTRQIPSVTSEKGGHRLS